MQIIRDGRLYRAEFDTFDEYAWNRWQMKANYANKLIRTWRIAEKLFELESNGSVPNGTTKKANQAQVWELVPVADTWDVDAAAFVYRTVIEVDGVPVTAEVLKGAVKTLPPGEFDAERAAARIRAYLGELADRQDEEAEPGLDYAARAAKAVSYQWVRRLAKKDTAGAIRYLDELQRQIDKCRAELLTVQDGTPVIPAPSEASAHDQASRVS